MRGQIYKIYSDSYYVKCDNTITKCNIRDVLKKQKASIVTGDFVEFQDNVINNILPRKNYIKRPAVANVDQIVIVSSLKQPDLDFIQLNRYITLANYYKIPVILCFNKEDLGTENGFNDKIVSIYSDLGYKLVFTSALKKNGINEFSRLLEDKISALCGNSGVGKSSLINNLNPDINLKTGSVSDKLNRGTHTTRHCEIIQLNESTSIIDTPGFSNVSFNFMLPKDVGDLFPEIHKYKNLCKYSDCLHIHEAGCEVLKHIDDIAPSRYQSYIEFVKEAFEYKEQVKYNGIKTETFHKNNNNKTVVKISEKKRQKARNTQKQDIYKELEENEY